MNRAFKMGENSRKIFDELSTEHRAVLDAYAAGIHKYLSEHPEKKPKWFDELRGLDIVMGEKAIDLKEAIGPVRTKIAKGPGGFDASDESNFTNPNRGKNPEMSTMWAIGPAKTKDGGTMHMSSPHRPFEELKWHECQIVVGDRWIYGFSMLGRSFGIGFTHDVAWGLTANASDNGDAYRLTLDPEDKIRYKYDGGWRNITTQKIKLEVLQKDGSLKMIERELRFSHHGPIVKEDAKQGVVYAIRPERL